MTVNLAKYDCHLQTRAHTHTHTRAQNPIEHALMYVRTNEILPCGNTFCAAREALTWPFSDELRIYWRPSSHLVSLYFCNNIERVSMCYEFLSFVRFFGKILANSVLLFPLPFGMGVIPTRVWGS
jgi:hypothetical protein